MTQALKGRELGGQRELEGGKAEGVTELEEEAFHEYQGHDRSASASCDRSWEAKILSLPFWKRCSRMRWDGFSGQVGLPMDARSSVPHSCAPHSCKIDIQMENYMFYLIMKPPRPVLGIMLQ